ncbi:ABC transporter ATP-binding protein [Macrococcus hajekii]|uniref:ABC transporter ATP-binding protein n=1 Tax=Macrococcus hajekii TaxID=198482 RepID=A0A4R6BN07_9STAP|nr:ABC transporter ATP-binding protein [Macrococcus hajekii]TDM03128.1 ABC transporter ATP-binding protein [Macrococcus hajekii]GGA96187.1 ABC transporter [Macrococcus hajekii]
MTKLELKNIRHSFGSNSVLNAINLTLSEGEFITILGPSGSGKSTLFNIIGGLLIPTSGSVLLEGQDITGSKGHVAYMPQSPSLMPWRTVDENIQLGREIKGQVDRARMDDLLQRSGFADIKDQYPDSLSGGMKQRVSFLRALNTPGELMLLDEPFSALDEITRIDMQRWLKEILEVEKRTILMITHSIDEAIKLSDKIVVLEGKPATIHQAIDVRYISETAEITLKQQLLELLR